MKKIYVLFLLAVLCASLVSCNDDKGEATPLSTINVLAAETSFESSESTGRVVVDCNPVAAYVDAVDQQWLEVRIEQNTVLLSAKRNSSTESRNTLLTIKKTANDSVTLNVDQKGMVFIVKNKADIRQLNDLAGEYSFDVSSEILAQIISTPDWVETNVTNDKLNIKVRENNEGHIREGYVKYSCGNVKDSIKVTQYDFEKDILGDYELWVGYDPKTDLCEGKVDVKLAANANGAVTLNFTALYGTVSLPIQIPVSFDQDSLSVSIASGQRVASYKDKRNKWTYFYTMFSSPTGSILPALDEAGDTIMQNTSGKITAYLSYEKKKGTYGGFSGLAYNEGGYSAEFKSMYIGAFTNSTPYKKNLVDNKWWFSISDLMLVKKEK